MHGLSKVLPTLLLSDYGSQRNLELLELNGVTHVLQVRPRAVAVALLGLKQPPWFTAVDPGRGDIVTCVKAGRQDRV